MNGGVPSEELYDPNEKLIDILNHLATNRDLLNEKDCIGCICILLNKGADPNVQGHNGKTLLHYVAERNDIEGIEFLLNKGADTGVEDHDGNFPLQYVTEDECLQAIQQILSNDPDSNKNQYYVSDGNPVNDFSNCPDPDGKHVTFEGQAPHDDSGYGSGNDNQTVSSGSSDCDTEEDSDCSSSIDYPFLKDSLLMKMKIPPTEDEQKLIDKFCGQIKNTPTQNGQVSEINILESIKYIVDSYLETGLRLNSCCRCCKNTITHFIFKTIEDVVNQFNVNPYYSSIGAFDMHDPDDTYEGDDNEHKASEVIIKSITSDLVLKGGVEKKLPYYGALAGKHYDFDYLDNLKEEYENRKKKLMNIAYEGIINKNNKQIHEYDFKAEIDNGYFCIEYPQDSMIEPAKILNNEKAKNLRVGILKVGESIVRVEKDEKGKRNYTDVLKGSIEMSFTTEVGKISIYLSPDKQDSNKIKVEIDEENIAKFNELKDKSSIGANCFLGGKSVLEAIKNRGFEKHGKVPATEFAEVKVSSRENGAALGG